MTKRDDHIAEILEECRERQRRRAYVDSLPLKCRTKNVLANAGVESPLDLVMLDLKKLKKGRNHAGPVTIKDIIQQRVRML